MKEYKIYAWKDSVSSPEILENADFVYEGKFKSDEYAMNKAVDFLKHEDNYYGVYVLKFYKSSEIKWGKLICIVSRIVSGSSVFSMIIYNI